MTDIIALPVEKRVAAGKGAARRIRMKGLVPGVIYGDKQAPLCIAMDPRPLIAQLKRAGFYSHQYDLELDGEKHRVMAQDVTFHPVTDAPQHVDFLRINKESLIHAKIAVVFINQDKSPGMKRGGALNIVHHEIEVIGHADDMPENVVVDLQTIDIGTSIHVSQLALPASVKVVHHGHEGDYTVATVVASSASKNAGADK